MSRIVYVNGDYLPEEDAKVSVFDRGFLFADGVYEVTTVLGGKLVDFDGHAKRLWRSMGELEMTPPCTEDVLWMVMTQPVHLSPAQIGAFRDVIHGNNRPVQPLNGRTIAVTR